METLIETIRAATAPEATPEARASGIEACRAIIAALGGEAPRTEPGPVANAIASLLRTTPPDQLLDMAIAKVRAALPPGSDESPPAPGFKFQRVALPQLTRGQP